MKAVTKVMIGAACLVALGAAAPASAQYYPGYGYGYGNNNPANVIGQVLGTILNPYAQNQYGYGHGMSPQMAAQRCSTAVQQRLSMQYRAGYGYGYNSGYSNARVLGITSVEPRSRYTTRVRGHATSGMNYGGYGYGYGYGHDGGADLSFKCDIDSRGYIRDIDIDRRY